MRTEALSLGRVQSLSHRNKLVAGVSLAMAGQIAFVDCVEADRVQAVDTDFWMQGNLTADFQRTKFVWLKSEASSLHRNT